MNRAATWILSALVLVAFVSSASALSHDANDSRTHAGTGAMPSSMDIPPVDPDGYPYGPLPPPPVDPNPYIPPYSPPGGPGGLDIPPVDPDGYPYGPPFPPPGDPNPYIPPYSPPGGPGGPGGV